MPKASRLYGRFGGFAPQWGPGETPRDGLGLGRSLPEVEAFSRLYRKFLRLKTVDFALKYILAGLSLWQLLKCISKKLLFYCNMQAMQLKDLASNIFLTLLRLILKLFMFEGLKNLLANNILLILY